MYMLQLVFILINGQRLKVLSFLQHEKDQCVQKFIVDNEGKATWGNCDFKNWLSYSVGGTLKLEIFAHDWSYLK